MYLSFSGKSAADCKRNRGALKQSAGPSPQAPGGHIRYHAFETRHHRRAVLPYSRTVVPAAEEYPHPFAADLAALVYRPDQTQAPAAKPKPPAAPEVSPLVWVDGVAALEAMVAELSNAEELAIDLEHHSHRWAGCGIWECGEGRGGTGPRGSGGGSREAVFVPILKGSSAQGFSYVASGA